MKTVGIVGGAGFIGSFVTKKFLQKGYQVRVSARNPEKSSHYSHLQQLPKAENLELYPLDVQDEVALRKFVSGCELLIHGGTPFQLDVKDPKSELFDPTIKGTENFLKIIKQTATVEKVVFIASVAAFNTNFPLLPEGKTNGDQITELDKPFMSEESHPYTQAKFMANQVVEKFIADHQVLSFEIVTVSPVGVMGKAMSGREYSTSMGVQYLFKNKIAPNPFFQMFYDLDVPWAMVDVTDVAEGVYQAAVIRGIHGRNYLLSSESYHISDITLMLNQQEPSGKPTIVYSNELARKELGMTFQPAKVPLRHFSN